MLPLPHLETLVSRIVFHRQAAIEDHWALLSVHRPNKICRAAALHYKHIPCRVNTGIVVLGPIICVDVQPSAFAREPLSQQRFSRARNAADKQMRRHKKTYKCPLIGQLDRKSMITAAISKCEKSAPRRRAHGSKGSAQMALTTARSFHTNEATRQWILTAIRSDSGVSVST